MKVNCLSCGHNITLEDGTYGDYEGVIKCFACSAILEVKLSEGCVKSVKLHVEPTGRTATERKNKAAMA